MKKMVFCILLTFALVQGCSPAKPSPPTPKPGWLTYSNDAYGYEIQYPEAFDLWPTGPEGKRDGASIRIAIKDHQAPAPVLDIRISPRTPELEFSGTISPSIDLTAESEAVSINGVPAKEWNFFWKSNGEIAFVEIYLDGVVFQFAAGSGLTDFHTSQWWNIVSTFRFKMG